MALRKSLRSSLLLLLGCAVGGVVASSSPPSSPHILMILVDDWGWGNFDIHNDAQEVVTPNLHALVDEGILLDQHYVFKYCSPSRCALQTGRNPIYVNVVNSPITQHNPSDLQGGYQGIPVNMTGIASKLRSANYATHQVGKWNAGMATTHHSPAGRGYLSSLHYFDYDTFFYNDTMGECVVNASHSKSDTHTTSSPSSASKSSSISITDLFDTSAPAYGQNNSWSCSQTNQGPNCTYQDDLFVNRVLNIIHNHNPSEPLFLFWAPHAPHDPYEVPAAYLNKFSNITQETRRYYAAMVNKLDDDIGTVVSALKATGLWDNMLVVASSDNGGPIGDHYGGNSYPLRGGKASNLQGGVRVNAFASGGLLPPQVRGTVLGGNTSYIAIEDWYATFCAIAGVNATDTQAAAVGLPPVTGLNMWPLLSGTNLTSPRNEVILGSSQNGVITANGATMVEGIIRADGYKLLVASSLSGNFLMGPMYPNVTGGYPSETLHCPDGCLFHILDDPTESHDLSGQYPEIVKEMKNRIAYLNTTVYSPLRGGDDGLACEAALTTWGGFWGPFVTL